MPRGEKPADTDTQKRQPAASDKGPQPKAASRPGNAWPTVNKLQKGKKADARRKVPSGPLGGSGRKTNLSRST